MLRREEERVRRCPDVQLINTEDEGQGQGQGQAELHTSSLPLHLRLMAREVRADAEGGDGRIWRRSESGRGSRVCASPGLGPAGKLRGNVSVGDVVCGVNTSFRGGRRTLGRRRRPLRWGCGASCRTVNCTLQHIRYPVGPAPEAVVPQLQALALRMWRERVLVVPLGSECGVRGCW